LIYASTFITLYKNKNLLPQPVNYKYPGPEGPALSYP
jgi:hypothetical protein